MATQRQRFTIAARLDRLPTHSFHKRLLGLVGGGMLIDNFDIYIAGSVLLVFLNSGWSTLESNATFVSATFAGMMIGTFAAGMIGDRYGRKLTFQINLAVFGLASLAGAFATDMNFLIAMRFVGGIGLGAEIVTGYSTLAEFVPPKSRGKWPLITAGKRPDQDPRKNSGPHLLDARVLAFGTALEQQLSPL